MQQSSAPKDHPAPLRVINILVIAPYQKFADEFAEVYKRHAIPVYVAGDEPAEYTIDLLVEYDHEKIRTMEPHCNVAIARGFSATLLRRGKEFVPVVEIPILPQDIIRCIKASQQRYGERHLTFVGSPLLAMQVESLANLLDLEMEIISVPFSVELELQKAFTKIRTVNPVIIGGNPVCEFSKKTGYDCMLIESGQEAMHSAISEAKRIAYSNKAEEEKAQRFKAILNYSADGIIAFNKSGHVTTINVKAEEMLGVKAYEAVGKRIDEFFPQSLFSAALAGATELSDEVLFVNNMAMVVNKTGIFMRDVHIGSMVTLQSVARLQDSEKRVRNKIAERGLIARHTFADIRGTSRAIKDVVRTAVAYSKVDSSVLILGQSGTGKEMFAQSIHMASTRRGGPFVAINCAALPENILESELFGYVEGAFTGASRGGKPGLIELAHAGTLFLDEISEMPKYMQGRLLRVLQEKQIMRLGHDKVTTVDIRIIAATNRDLLSLVEDGDFREDLYYRLDVLTLHIPPLRDRPEDIGELAYFFLDYYGNVLHKGALQLTEDALGILRRHPWPGNIRELRNACERLVVLSSDMTVTAAHLQTFLDAKLNRKSLVSKPGLMRPPVTEETVLLLLEQGYSKAAIASKLGIDRSTLWRKMKSWAI